MKTLLKLLTLLVALHVTLMAASPVGSWEIDTKSSLKANGKLSKQERMMVGMLSQELFAVTFNADKTALLSKKDEATWKKVLGNSYLIEVDSHAINILLVDKTHLQVAFDMGGGPAINLLYVPEGTLKEEPRILPKNFAYYGKPYRSELTMGEGKYKFMKLSKDGTLYQYYGSSEKTVDPALIKRKVAKFSGEAHKLTLDLEKGVIELSDDDISFTILGMGKFTLATYVDPSIKPNKTMPWTQESVKAYTLKNPTLKYHVVGYDMFERKSMDENRDFTIEDYKKKFFDNPAGTMYKLTTKDDDGSLYRWSELSPFVPNHVPKKNAHKIKYTIEGEQSVTTPAGTFTCSILNLDADGEVIKAWMIKDRPGVYAKFVTMMGTFTLIK